MDLLLPPLHEGPLEGRGNSLEYRDNPPKIAVNPLSLHQFKPLSLTQIERWHISTYSKRPDCKTRWISSFLAGDFLYLWTICLPSSLCEHWLRNSCQFNLNLTLPILRISSATCLNQTTSYFREKVNVIVQYHRGVYNFIFHKKHLYKKIVSYV